MRYHSVTDLLTGLGGAESGSPRLTWYGLDGERVELSGAVLRLWAAKTANLLVEEFDAGPQTRLGLALPAHWRAVVLALGAWWSGAEVALPPALDPVDVLVTAEPTPDSDVVVALPALARAHPAAADQSSRWLDYAGEIGSHSDFFVPSGPSAGATWLTHAQQLIDVSWPTHPRVAVVLRGDSAEALPDMLAWVLAALVADGSVVLMHPGAARDAAAVDRLCAQENVEVRAR